MTKVVENKILQEDLNEIAASAIPFEKMKNSVVLITGATGLIGSLLVKTLLHVNQMQKLNIKVLAMVRNLKKAEMLYGEVQNQSDLEFVVGDIKDVIGYDGAVDYIFHCASVTTSRTMVEKPVETLMTTVDGTKNVLNFAKLKNCHSVVYVSSMEVYGTFANENNNVTEDELGYIDPLKVRSNYPEGKRLCENMCVAYHKEYQVPVKIARLAQTFGAGILPGENRVFAQFARSAMAGEDIMLHTTGESEGNYCYTSDAIKGLLTILLLGKDGEAYNVANPETHTTIRAMAEMVCNTFSNGKSKVVFDIPETNVFGYAASTKMKLNSGKLQQLGWKPTVGLKEAYQRMILSIQVENDTKTV